MNPQTVSSPRWAAGPLVVAAAPAPSRAGRLRRAAMTGLLVVVVSLAGCATPADRTSSGEDVATPRTPSAAAPTAGTPSQPGQPDHPDEPEVERVTVPDLTGMTRRQARAALTEAGLQVRGIRRVPSAAKPGTVLRQGTGPGGSRLAGSAINLVLAAPYPRVPTVVGRPRAAAVERLRAAGFTVEVVVRQRTSGRSGVVLRQSPQGGAQVAPGSQVRLTAATVVTPKPAAVAPVRTCTEGYRPCLTPAPDYDCAGGSGNGPRYAQGPIYVDGSDPYDLDRDGDGVACER